MKNKLTQEQLNKIKNAKTKDAAWKAYRTIQGTAIKAYNAIEKPAYEAYMKWKPKGGE